MLPHDEPMRQMLADESPRDIEDDDNWLAESGEVRAGGLPSGSSHGWQPRELFASIKKKPVPEEGFADHLQRWPFRRHRKIGLSESIVLIEDGADALCEAWPAPAASWSWVRVPAHSRIGCHTAEMLGSAWWEVCGAIGQMHWLGVHLRDPKPLRCRNGSSGLRPQLRNLNVSAIILQNLCCTPQTRYAKVDLVALPPRTKAWVAASRLLHWYWHFSLAIAESETQAGPFGSNGDRATSGDPLG
jgi:hypothetical protein